MVTNSKLPVNFVKSVVLAWIGAIAIDFLLNAGVFASFFASGDSFLLSPSQAFLRIPAGYASLFLLTLVLAVLIYRGKEMRAIEGMRMGLLYGTATSLVLVLGLWSITTAPPAFLAIWFLDQILEMTAAGTIIASARRTLSRRITMLIIVGALACFFVGVTLQNLLT